MNERTGGYNQREGQACEEGFRRSWMNAQHCASRRQEKKKRDKREDEGGGGHRLLSQSEDTIKHHWEE